MPACQVFVLHSANRSKSAATLQALQQQAAQHERVVVFLDNDTAGRQGRKVLDQALPACWHAFLPLTLEDADRALVGVEDAGPATIRKALGKARLATPDRHEFSRSDILAWGLAAQHGAEQPAQCKQRRHQLCVKLGLGPCDGKQLLQQLNRFDFSRAEVEEALKDLAP